MTDKLLAFKLDELQRQDNRRRIYNWICLLIPLLLVAIIGAIFVAFHP